MFLSSVSFHLSIFKLPAAKTVYLSCSSDDEELLGSHASKCLMLQESPVQQYQLHQFNVDRNNMRISPSV
jgi:hypothetical protein